MKSTATTVFTGQRTYTRISTSSSFYYSSQLNIPTYLYPCIFLLLTLQSLPCSAQTTPSPTPSPTFNSIDAPVIVTRQFVHTAVHAQLPDEGGLAAKINSIITHRNNLYITTLTRIYRLPPFNPQTSFLSSSSGTSQLPTPELVLDVQDAIDRATDGERKLDISNTQHGGVRSVAFAPRSRSGRFYVTAMETRPNNVTAFKYVSDAPNHINTDSVLLEFRLFPQQRQRNSEEEEEYEIWMSYRVVFRIGMPKFDHTIRTLLFGPHDGMLYVSHGDGSEQDGATGGGQNEDGLGKILRIDPQRRLSRATRQWVSYTVPLDNPFVGDSHVMIDEVYAYGFRNPHHMCFDRSGDNLYVAETGRANAEEINLVEPGRNYGWSEREGIFVHKGGGLGSGVEPLPEDDEERGFTYPNAIVGHYGPWSAGFVGQAIGGGCPVENDSGMSGSYWYDDFPISGTLYFSRINELKSAVTMGSPDSLTQAPTRRANICYHDQNDLVLRDVQEGEEQTVEPRIKRADDLGQVLRMDPGFEDLERADVRLGRGPYGEMYWSSKRNGKVYVFLSSLEDEEVMEKASGRCDYFDR